ncbi:MAG TPA: hypothetical protein VI959_01940 [Alphaproteobacteria bacterium]|nr:hypothetical protein [Alphaproteobacteria bacterium]
MSDITYESVISSLGMDGDGLAEVEGKKFYIPYTVPGDKVTFHEEKIKKYTRLFVDELIANESNRKAPLCEHFTKCGGCKLQHVNDALYLEFKVGLLKKALDFHRVEAKEWRELKIIPPYKRRRISLTFARRHEGFMLGYSMRQRSYIVDAKECPLVLPEIEVLIPKLRELLSTLFPTRESGHVDILMSKVGLDVNLNASAFKKITADQAELLSTFASTQNLARLRLNYKPFVTFKEPICTFSGIDIKVEAGKFLQASQEADTFMLERVEEYMPKTFKRGADLFSGRGTFTFLMARYAPTDAFECEKVALQALEEGAKHSKNSVNAIKRDLFESPLTVEELNEYDFVFVDPPRAGALKQVQAIASSTLKQVVYISCNPASFARDAQILIQDGFELASVTPLDQFLWSEHLEVIGHFVRR